MRHLSAGRPASHYHTLARSAPARVPPATARADGVGASTVYVVDDDAEQRAAIEFLLASVKCSVQAFDSASAFLDAGIEPAGVMILDMRMPGLSGLGLQQRLAWSPLIEIIFLSGVAEVPDSVAAMKAGAWAGAMPANVSDSDRAMVTAGLANDVDEVNQYAPTM